MPVEFQTILPANATGFERALEQVSGERWPALDVDIVRRTKDPWACPEHLLPYLAYERSVDIWDEDWPTWKKRAVIASAPQDHRRKGTLDGMARYLRIVGASIDHVWRPPSGYRLGRGMTEAERLAWLSRYPELRIYRGRRRFALRGLVLKRRFIAGRGAVLAPDDAAAYAIPQAFLHDRGIETKLVVARREPIRRRAIVEEAVEVRVPKAMRGMVLGHSFAGSALLGVDDAAARVYTLVTRQQQEIADGSVLAVDVLRPDLAVIDVRSQFVRERFALNGLVDSRSRIGRAFLVPDRAVDHIYTRTRLFDPTRPLVARHGGGAVIGRDLVNIAHHTARIRVRIRQQMPRRGMMVGAFLRGRLVPRQDRALTLTLGAMRSAKRLSDKVLAHTQTTTRATISNGLEIGAFTIGELRRVI